MLAVVASAIGASRRLAIKSGWKAPSILWTTTIGESGSSKTPAFNAALKPIHTRHRRSLQKLDAEIAAHEEALEVWKKKSDQWRGDKRSLEPPPPKPETPTCHREFVDNTTVEALAGNLKTSPRGLLLGCDELSALFGSFGKYTGGKGNDAAQYLSMYSGQPITVDRKTGNRPTLFVPSASLSITGGIQPGILRKSLGSEHIENGLAARFLMAMPPRRAKVWTDDDIPAGIERAYESLIDKLFKLEGEMRDDGSMAPRLMYFAADGFAAWTDYFNAHNAEQVEMAGALGAAWSKLEETVARLALIFHLVRVVNRDPTIGHAERVDAASVQSAITLASWFKNEAKRVYGKLTQGDEAEERDRLIDLIELQGGSITAWRLAQLKKGWDTEYAKARLLDLVKNKFGRLEWIESNSGPKSREFILTQPPGLGVGGNSNESEELLDLNEELEELTDELDDSAYIDPEVF